MRGAVCVRGEMPYCSECDHRFNHREMRAGGQRTEFLLIKTRGGSGEKQLCTDCGRKLHRQAGDGCVGDWDPCERDAVWEVRKDKVRLSNDGEEKRRSKGSGRAVYCGRHGPINSFAA